MTTTNRKISHSESGEKFPEIRINAAVDSFDLRDGFCEFTPHATNTPLTLSQDVQLCGFIKLIGSRSVVLDLKIDVILGYSNPILFWNTCGQTVTVKTTASGSTGIAIPNNKLRLLAHNGTDVSPAGAEVDSAGIITAPTSANPTARIYHSADQAIPDATWTTLNFNSERIDTDTMHDNSTNNSRITIKTAGNYPASVDIAFASNNTGIRAVRLLANGATQIALKQVGATQGFATVIDLSMPPYPFSVNDYIQAQVYQNSGGSLNVLNVGNYSPEFGMWKV
jgi:hypothetical protein